MQDERYPKIAYNGYVHGVRKRERPKKRWMHMIREDCKALIMTLQEATYLRQNRRVWEATIDERHRLGHEEEKRYFLPCP